LEKDNETGWWIAELNGEMGLVPKNYVEEIPVEQEQEKKKKIYKELNKKKKNC